MASGGRDSESDPGFNDSAAGRGRPTAGSGLYQLNMFNSQLSTPAMNFPGNVVLNMNAYSQPRFQSRHQRPDMDDQALWPTPPPEDMSHHFSEDELARVIEEKYLSYVANYCDETSNWRRLARKLKLDPPSVTRLEENYHDNTREFIYQLLLTWKRRHPEVRVHDLIKVLSESKLQKPALELKKFFSSIHCAE